MTGRTDRSPLADLTWEPDRARIGRKAFVDPGIHSAEIDRIFNRSWLFVGHESEIPNAGDYVVRPMGEDSAIINRGKDGVIRGFLNSCRHRGVKLCRADAGNAKVFVCPYHAWTYDAAGPLRTTSYDQHYDKADLETLGLIPVGRIDSYNGLIFATWDPDAVPLSEHLGDLRFYLDILFARTPGGMTVIRPPQRWIVETNWKIPALNFLDSQHALRTHAGPLAAAQAAGAPPPAELAKAADMAPQLTFPQGHGVVIGPTVGLPPFFGHPPDLVPLYEQTLSPEALAQLRDLPPMVGTIFPHTSWVQPLLAVELDKPPASFLALHNWQPAGPGKVEIWCWYFTEAEASDEWRDTKLRLAIQTFGMGGIFDEDDAEAWAAIYAGSKGPIASRVHADFSAGLGMEPMSDYPGPGTAYASNLVEQAQFGYLRRWKAMLDAGETEDKA